MKTYIPAFLLAAILQLGSQYLTAQTVAITVNPGQSGNIVIGTNSYHVSESVYTDAEIGSNNFTSAATAINHIDFNAFAIGSVTTVNNFNLYLKEVPASTTAFTNAAAVYDTAGYTKVFSGTFNAAVTGWVGVDLNTPFQRNSGNNLMLLIERLDGVAHGSYSFNATRGNSTDIALNSSRRINTATLPVPGVTVLNTLTSFRPQIQLRHINANDAAVTTVYTLGKLPIPYASPHVIAANISNNGSGTLSNLAVTLNITGANTFSDVQTIPSLAPGAAVKIYFNPASFTNTGYNTVTVSIPNDDFNSDNSVSIPQEITSNAYTYAYGTTPTSSVGLNGNTGDFVAMFTSNTASSINQVGVNFTAGGQPFRIGIWDKSGAGKPGNLLWESSDLISTTGVFTLPIIPAVNITDTFYIGVRQTGTTNIQFAYQNETPIRSGTFFFTSPSGTNTWTDFAPSNPFKFMIEPRLTVANDVGVSFISNPLGSAAIDNCGIRPQATVTNFGSNDQLSAFDINFVIKQSGNTVYSDQQQVTLLSGASATISFSPFNGSVSGTDSSFVYTTLASDAARGNDTVMNRFTTGNYSYLDSSSATGGYSFANSTPCAAPAVMQPVYNWINETTDSIDWAANGDDSVLATPLTLPFSFNYFGVNYSQVWICSNGWISFTNPSALTTATTRTPVSIPLAGGIDNYIAGVLTDLDNTATIYPDAYTYFGGNLTQFVITFYHAHLFGSATDYITFQFILKVNGDIIVQYNDAESNIAATGITNYCSAGIENAGGNKGIQYRLNGSGGSLFGSPLAVEYYTGAGTVVPVNLLSFTASKLKSTNQIKWTSSQEINTKNFVVERSNNGISFTDIAAISAAGNSSLPRSYAFTDIAPFNGDNYYRLRLTDNNGSFVYSTIKHLINEDADGTSIYPNPASGDRLQVIVNTHQSGLAKMMVFDITGTPVLTHNQSLTDGSNIATIKTGFLPAGNYILKILLNDKTIIKKFSKR